MDVVVLGGGIVGCAVASGCARQGLRVMLVERRSLASVASSLDLALLGLPVPPELEPLARAAEKRYLELHHFTGGAFFLDRTPIAADGVPEPGVRRIDPRGAALALAEEARSYRAEIVTSREAKGLLVKAGSVRGLRTDGGEIRAAAVVVAAGAESWRVCRDLPLHVPTETAEGLVTVYPPGTRELERPLVAEGSWAAADASGCLVVTVGAGTSATLLPDLAHVEPLDRTVLRYGVTADDLPLHGPVAAAEGVALVCGHGLRGIALAPAVGDAVAEALATGTWDEAFLPDRVL